jgi:hypothetical protein
MPATPHFHGPGVMRQAVAADFPATHFISSLADLKAEFL